MLVAALVVAGLIAMVPLGAAVTGEPGAQAGLGDGVDAGENVQVEAENDTRTGSANATTDLSPGERLSGVIGVQGAEVDGEVSSRSFEIRLAEAETDEERAAVVAAQLERNERRLAELRERREELRQRRDAGNVSPGAYAARTAAIGTQAATVNRTTNRSAEVAAGLPAEALAERGVDADRIRTLRDRASELSGPETAAIAREIGGNRTGAPMGPDRAGPPGSGIGTPGGDTPGVGSPGADTSDAGGNASEPRNGSAADGPARGGTNRSGATTGENATDGNTTNGNTTDGDETGERAGSGDGGDGVGSDDGGTAGSDDDDNAGSDADSDSNGDPGAGDGASGDDRRGDP